MHYLCKIMQNLCKIMQKKTFRFFLMFSTKVLLGGCEALVEPLKVMVGLGAFHEVTDGGWREARDSELG